MDENIKKLFIRNVQILKYYGGIVNNFSNLHIPSQKLKESASRINVPKPFEVYINYIEENTNTRFPSNIFFTKEEVLDKDLEIIKSFSSENFDFSKLNLDRLLRAAYITSQELGIILPNSQKHTKISLQSSLEQYPRGTSSGFPIFKKKGNQRAIDDATDFGRKFLEKPNLKDLLFNPTAVFHRYQYKYNLNTSSLYKKVRQVWGVSYRVLGLEGVYFRNMINNCTDRCLSSNIPPATWGRTLPNLSKTLIPHLRSYRKKIISTDIESFDSSVPGFMWALFYAISRYNIADLDPNDLRSLDYLMVFDCYTPYCHMSTKLKFQRKGVPSGSLKTSLFDTFVNRTIINYSCLEFTNGKNSAGDTCSVLGDDNVIVQHYTDLRTLESCYARFGMKLNRDKTSVRDYNQSYEFLGYIWDDQNRPTQTESWYISHLCIPSRFFSRDLNIPIPILQTSRAVTICMVLYKGIETFERLIGDKDYIWSNLKKQYHTTGTDPFLYWVSEDQRNFGTRIPMSKILFEGWIGFG